MKLKLLAATAVLALAAAGIASAGPPAAVGATRAQIGTVVIIESTQLRNSDSVDFLAANPLGNTAFVIVAPAKEVPAPGAIAAAKTDADQGANSGAAFSMAPNVGMSMPAAAYVATTVNRGAALGLFYNKSPPGRFDT